ncbi:hypothetical protein NQD34_006124 [Periophthalmus magnuspinnatus]|nr:hypothetical protein NQD34_006124 [Periophthalmus magnuspinnatus]
MAKHQTSDFYTAISKHDGKSSRGDAIVYTALSSPAGHPRKNRAVLGPGVTIQTLPSNMTRIVEDSGKYYIWRSFGPDDQHTRELWVDMGDLRHGQVRLHGILSNAHKQAARVVLSFDFPFYGHFLRQITIATGGFIFTGDITHRMLTTTQYIAPLMANFDPSFSKDSTVQYLDNGEVFVVQWGKVRLQGREKDGAFTFQAALHKSGTISFSYREIPVALAHIGSADHPVKAGLSDAFMVTSSTAPAPDGGKQTVYEYHRVTIESDKIQNNSAIEFTPLPTCLQLHSCELCHSADESLGCSWCHVLQRCSDGMDRHRQEWTDYACFEESEDFTCEDYFRDENSTDSSVSSETEGKRGVTGVNGATTLQNGCKKNGASDGTKTILKTGNDINSDSSSRRKEPNLAIVAGAIVALVLVLALVVVAVFINCYPAVASPLHHIQRRNSYWPALKFQNQKPGYTEMEADGNDRD